MIIRIGRDKDGKRTVNTHSTWWAPFAGLFITGTLFFAGVLIAGYFDIDPLNLMNLGFWVILSSFILYPFLAVALYLLGFLVVFTIIPLEKIFGISQNSWVASIFKSLARILFFIGGFMLSPIQYLKGNFEDELWRK